MAVQDIFADGIKSGWDVMNASRLEDNSVFYTDVVIIGTGAGGGVAAEILTKAGLNVLMVEHGPLKSSNDFNMRESEAYASLYQESGTRMNKAGSITVLQGRAVGGSTTVNWTSSFRTPSQTLDHWAEKWDVTGCSLSDMAPWFEYMEKRLGIQPWQVVPNRNNAVLSQGCSALGYTWQTILRNVRGCWNLGYCGMGCPTNAKQGMLVTTLPSALKNGGKLLFLCEAQKLEISHGRATEVLCRAMANYGNTPLPIRIRIKAGHVVLSGGAINTPALLLRSHAPDPNGLLGKRTFIHPVAASMSRFEEKIQAWEGAPQSVYSDQFQWKDGVNGVMGYKLEALPLHPSLTAALIPSRGRVLQERMEQYPQTNCLLALLRDGFHEESQGGTIQLHDDGSAILDYNLDNYEWDGVRRALLTMAEIQFAAGAKEVLPLHQEAGYSRSWKACRNMINALSLEPYLTQIGTAHLMGGCAMSDSPLKGVVNSWGGHHQLDNVSVMDGSVFPTSIGANPQLSIYGLAAKWASHLADQLLNNSHHVRSKEESSALL
ncbi:putative GMC-type oxidoreductase [invertebrate metagenome]|uniref:Putative GMC-type oxidoreductase n=1 Tax=invertebrate metagenome TaxID=1711999 RepID=A0A2H9T8L2_9ZZZZ